MSKIKIIDFYPTFFIGKRRVAPRRDEMEDFCNAKLRFFHKDNPEVVVREIQPFIHYCNRALQFKVETKFLTNYKVTLTICDENNNPLPLLPRSDRDKEIWIFQDNALVKDASKELPEYNNIKIPVEW